MPDCRHTDARSRPEAPDCHKGGRVVLRRHAVLAVARDRDVGGEADLMATGTVFRGLSYPIWLARVQLERAERLARQGRPVASGRLAEQAAAGFETVGAVPMLARARTLLESQAVW